MLKLLQLTVLLYFPFFLSAQQPLATLPIDYVEELMFIEIKLNDGEEPLHLMFDTGANITVLEATVSDRYQLIISDSFKINTSGKSLITPISKNNRFVLNDNLELDSIEIAVMDLQHLSEYLRTKVDGIIGSDLLNRLIVETNVDSKVIHLYSYDQYEGVPAGVPLEIQGLEMGHIGIPIAIRLDKHAKLTSMMFKIDTGADNYLTFHNAAVQEYELLDLKGRLKPKKGFGADATISNNVSGKIYEAELCGESFKKFPVVFEIDSLNQLVERPADGLVGQAILKRFNITYLLKAGLVYLEEKK